MGRSGKKLCSRQPPSESERKIKYLLMFPLILAVLFITDNSLIFPRMSALFSSLVPRLSVPVREEGRGGGEPGDY